MDNTLKKYLLVSEKTWHDSLFSDLSDSIPGEWIRISRKEAFTEAFLLELKPEKIFIPHWSYMIPPGIYENFECIVFHMTDLPFGRGGSPLQNLIVLGYTETVISALRVEKQLDTGDIYLKRPLSLEGRAIDIFEKASFVIKDMIKEIILHSIIPVPQQGDAVVFKRRSKEDGDISSLEELSKIYDHIRMLDCEGYPPAFLETKYFRFEFSNASFSEDDKNITANVRISKK